MWLSFRDFAEKHPGAYQMPLSDRLGVFMSESRAHMPLHDPQWTERTAHECSAIFFAGLFAARTYSEGELIGAFRQFLQRVIKDAEARRAAKAGWFRGLFG